MAKSFGRKNRVFLDMIDQAARDGGRSHGSWWIPPDSFVLDGTAPPTPAIQGTDGQALADMLQFADAADDIVFLNFVLPADYGGELEADLPWFANVSGTTEVCTWAGTVRAFDPSAGVDAVDAAGTAFTAVTTPAPAVADDVTISTLKLDPNNVFQPGDHVLVMINRDISEDDLGADAELLGARITYRRA